MYVFGAPNLSIYKSHAFAVLDYVVGPPLSLSHTQHINKHNIDHEP